MLNYLLLVTRATLVVTGALLVVTRFAIRNKKLVETYFNKLFDSTWIAKSL